jgi:hypothetical protein
MILSLNYGPRSVYKKLVFLTVGCDNNYSDSVLQQIFILIEQRTEYQFRSILQQIFILTEFY